MRREVTLDAEKRIVKAQTDAAEATSNAKKAAASTLRTREYTQRLALLLAVLSPLCFGVVIFGLLVVVVHVAEPMV